MKTHVAAITFLLVLTQLNIGGQSFTPAQSITYFPEAKWTVTAPEDQGMSNETLNEMMQFIEDSEASIRGLVVTRNGYIVKEGYWFYNTENTTRHIFSCTKSFVGALIGIALKEGFLDNVSQRMIDFFPHLTINNMDARKEAITLEHLLTMTTGLDWNEWNVSYFDLDNMYSQMFLASDNAVQFFLDLPTVYDPGEHWVYTTGASHILSAIIQEVTNMTTYDFAMEYLFEPLNMTIGSWAVDNQGVNNGGTQLYVTPRSMAKLGLLYLNKGAWDGQEIITEEYVTQSSTPHANAMHLAPYYGYQWWVGAREGVYSAMGSEGQYIHVVPEYNIVLSMTASFDDQNEDISEDILEYVLDSVLVEDASLAEILPIIGLAAVVIVVVVVAVLYVRRP